VVVKEHDHVTLTLVAPVTVAVNVSAWLTTKMSLEGLTATTMTLAVLPPHPATPRQTAAQTNAAILKIFANLIPTVSPKTIRQSCTP
jgi:anthranilate/para-aminobenzoate synthase component II